MAGVEERHALTLLQSGRGRAALVAETFDCPTLAIQAGPLSTFSIATMLKKSKSKIRRRNTEPTMVLASLESSQQPPPTTSTSHTMGPF
ncbi:hypothetical protein MRX96_002722 [Rhipicephalus microplus]